jgi:hypothetical protein
MHMDSVFRKYHSDKMKQELDKTKAKSKSKK